VSVEDAACGVLQLTLACAAFEKIFGRPAVRDGRNATHAAHDEL
jgi:hypothetical protein